MSTRVKLDDIWPGPWPPLGTGPSILLDCGRMWSEHYDWKKNGPPRWAGREVTLLWHSDPTIWSKAK